MNLELFDIQGIVGRGYGKHPAAAYLLLEVESRVLARRWLAEQVARVHTCEQAPDPEAPCFNIAFTHAGLEALGLDAEALHTFPSELKEGMTEPERSRALGDEGGAADPESSPKNWDWGGTAAGQRPVHLMLMVFAPSEADLETTITELSLLLRPGGLSLVRRLHTSLLADQEGGVREHFGFRDAISQPGIVGLHRSIGGQPLVPAGEFILGYENAYGLHPECPRVHHNRDPDRLLPPAEFGTHDLGRNGTYLVVRQLGQRVRAFWQFLDAVSRDPNGATNPQRRVALAARMVGRWPSGAPLVESPTEDDPARATANSFGYHKSDPQGLRCPLGAHIRRSNPRDSLDPAPGTAASLAVNATHRLLRRGRTYGPPLSTSFDPDEILQADEGEERGIHFICINANITRQFEFVQRSWINNSQFDGLLDETDPLLGTRRLPSGRPTDNFSIPGCPVRQRISGLPTFVVVRGGAYFFLPSLSAIRYLASLTT
jgi:Dyp-type peroxidase family